MKRYIILFCFIAAGTRSLAQSDSIVVPEPPSTTVQSFIDIVLMNNAELRASAANVESEQARAKRSGILPPPDIRLIEENMPGFDPSTAMYQRIELMQTIPFPTKLSGDRAIATMMSLHASHDEAELVGTLIARVKRQFAELWFVQQNLVLQRERRRIIREMLDVALERYKSGISSRQQDLLKLNIELSEAESDTVMLSQREQSLWAILAGASNGVSVTNAVLQDGLTLIPPLDSLLAQAGEYRSMLLHDSLNILQQKAVADRAAQEYFPDITLGVQRVTAPADDFRGWTVSLGLSLPFAPWSLAGISSKREEAEATVKNAVATYAASRLQIESAIKDLFYQALAAKQRMTTIRTAILPQAEQLLNVSLAGYRVGTTDFTMMLDSERMYLEQMKEFYAARLMFEQAVADLEREVGTQFFLVSN